MNRPTSQHASGFVLVTALIFLLIIMFGAISTMESTQLDYKISSNSAFKDVAFQASETGRTSVGDAVSQYMYDRDWTGVSVDGLSYTATYDPSTDKITDDEDLYQTDSMSVDMEVDISRSNIETIESDISIVKAQGVTSKGSGIQQLAGYEGTGKSAGNGGVNIIFEFRSVGFGASQATAVTASEYRVIP